MAQVRRARTHGGAGIGAYPAAVLGIGLLSVGSLMGYSSGTGAQLGRNLVVGAVTLVALIALGLQLRCTFRPTPPRAAASEGPPDRAGPSRAALPSIEEGLHRAVERSELVLHYQPAVRLADGALSGVEALVRWQRPGGGLLLPGQFVPVAEETGLIEPIDAWVLEEACRQLAVWREELTADGLRVAVNVSARLLRRAEFPALVARVLESTGLPASALTLELLASALVGDGGQAPATLAALREMSVALAIDDFGTGYSPLGYLQAHPLDELKIDRPFVARLGPRGSGDAVLRALVDLGHSLGMRVVAEGVEHVEQLLALRRLGCDIAQGYYISHPVPAPELEQALAQGRAWELLPVPVA